jgi:hypothetical protein
MFSKARALPILALGAILIGAPACKKKETPPPPPDKITYFFRSSDKSLIGNALVIAGRRLRFEKRVMDSSHTVAEASLTIPSADPSPLKDLAIPLPSPCGEKSVALSFPPPDEAQARRYGGSVYVDVTPSTPLPSEWIDVWLDAEPGATDVKAGSATLTRGRTRLFEPKCMPTIPVKAGTTDLGTIEVKPPRSAYMTNAYFVTTRTSTCYTFERVVYGAAPTHHPLLRGAQVYLLEDAEDIEYFLNPAPEHGRPDSATHELVVANCDGSR